MNETSLEILLRRIVLKQSANEAILYATTSSKSALLNLLYTAPPQVTLLLY